mmetsp:Transcript_87226/g.154513  ORF Transcript_87226/g.154513 Transcript_87226/m.154513 type:complete len:253 (-) Transcript_87226:88-846(-)|eukprot:CAMPEP_0197627528 /NCGR_PEP_ID=MMETSP1338-20131121/6125_1 /TAXON_ID=43686 ORGANISM="Pelagodinium beii, Strain RCC1491" /NCGR_SAMPLE_ID=MMETSP1338 /ASSEMBLY_ACC=CAM_ASM_000754 /LENGTH=252 /DNA_ID=CAMNT_0043198273 /DNA_START=13 /DNA_END=771 /DNA_ORIENTATION=+
MASSSSAEPPKKKLKVDYAALKERRRLAMGISSPEPKLPSSEDKLSVSSEQKQLSSTPVKVALSPAAATPPKLIDATAGKTPGMSIDDIAEQLMAAAYPKAGKVLHRDSLRKTAKSLCTSGVLKSDIMQAAKAKGFTSVSGNFEGVPYYKESVPCYGCGLPPGTGCDACLPWRPRRRLCQDCENAGDKKDIGTKAKAVITRPDINAKLRAYVLKSRSLKLDKMKTRKIMKCRCGTKVLEKVINGMKAAVDVN